MIRRQLRERREFIYRKSEQARANKIESRKREQREEEGLHLQDKLNKPTYEQQQQAIQGIGICVLLLVNVWLLSPP